ncbi:CPK3, partial [Symbiodinium sp. KB8]
MVLEALVPVRAVEQANKIFPMLGGRSNLGKEVRQQVEDIKLEISAAVAEAKEAGCKFALSTDSWKSKTVKHRHFICILLDWVSTCWERFSTCVHVSEIRAPRTAEKYQEHIRAALEEMGLVLDDITCVLTDHESAVRAAARSFNNALGRRRDPEHVAMQAALAPLVKKARKLLKWFLHNPDEYIFMEEQAKQNNLSFISFRRETATRWSSTQDMMMSLVRNAPAMQVYAQTQGRSKQSFPGVLTDAEIKELSQLATVMHPFLTCTRMMEGARTPCSLYLVLVHQLKAAMINRARDMKVPQELHKQCGKALRGRDLLPLPKRLAAFLAADLDKVCKKHIANTTAQDLLAMATYLDPRFRTHAALSMEERAKAKQSVAEWAYKTHEAGPELEAHMQEVAAHPDNRRLEDLIQPAASSRGKIAPPSSVVLPKRVGRALKQVDSTDDFVFGPSSSTAGVNPDEDK